MPRTALRAPRERRPGHNAPGAVRAVACPHPIIRFLTAIGSPRRLREMNKHADRVGRKTKNLWWDSRDKWDSSGTSGIGGISGISGTSGMSRVRAASCARNREPPTPAGSCARHNEIRKLGSPAPECSRARRKHFRPPPEPGATAVSVAPLLFMTLSWRASPAPCTAPCSGAPAPPPTRQPTRSPL